MQVTASYVECLNRALEQQGLSMDALARRTGYPLDLVQPLLAGSPITFSREMHTHLCEALKLDPQEIWSRHVQPSRAPG